MSSTEFIPGASIKAALYEVEVVVEAACKLLFLSEIELRLALGLSADANERDVERKLASNVATRLRAVLEGLDGVVPEPETDEIAFVRTQAASNDEFIRALQAQTPPNSIANIRKQIVALHEDTV